MRFLVLHDGRWRMQPRTLMLSPVNTRCTLCRSTDHRAP
jgi:hypothetical protein